MTALLTRRTQDGRPRVLVLEDNPVVRVLLTRLLEEHGYEVVAVASLAEVDAVYLHFEILVADLHVLDGGAEDTIARIPRWAPVPVIVYSAYLTPERTRECYAAGAAWVLDKTEALGDGRNGVPATIEGVLRYERRLKGLAQAAARAGYAQGLASSLFDLVRRR